ncbi:calcium-binding protein [Streptomyces sp. GESEQ-35]|uniref:calcium-binding protein n=1 Tax=Streptomyces sp. GESEQ-35 TaxID=2812657 RepID=UPI001FF66A71|nr:calcium-binding protein [Streptomyces sp. GESEQ-35]
MSSRSSRPGGRLTRRAVSVLAPVLGLGIAVPIALAGQAGAAAPAATAAVNEYGWHLTYTAADGQSNQVAITQSYTDDRAKFTYVIDDNVPVEAGNGCSHPDSADKTTVSCTVEAPESQSPLNSMEMDLGDGNDTATFDNATDQVYYFNTVELGDGADTWASNADRRVDGSSVKGGAGEDTITVGANGSAEGGDDNDTLHADGTDGTVHGGAGDDEIRGGKGVQDLRADEGDDTVYGGAGDDRMWGNSGDDKLYGGPGKDEISGGPGNNVIVQD